MKPFFKLDADLCSVAFYRLLTMLGTICLAKPLITFSATVMGKSMNKAACKLQRKPHL